MHQNIAAQPAAPLLSTRAMLVGLRVTQWTARKLDKGATNDVTTAAGAADDAGRFNKLLIGKDALADIVTAANKARSMHYARTLPWLDDGARILPAAAFLPYSEEMRRIRMEFETAVSDFVADYDVRRDESRRRLGSLFSEADYPNRDEIRARFSFSFRVLPMPSAADFRAEISDYQAQAIRDQIETDMRAALRTATLDVWQRIADVTGAMVDRLSAFKPGNGTDRATGIFRDSLVENVRALVAILPTLNLTADPHLSALTDRMAAELCRYDAPALREDEGARDETRKAAEAIFADVQAYL